MEKYPQHPKPSASTILQSCSHIEIHSIPHLSHAKDHSIGKSTVMNCCRFLICRLFKCSLKTYDHRVYPFYRQLSLRLTFFEFQFQSDHFDDLIPVNKSFRSYSWHLASDQCRSRPISALNSSLSNQLNHFDCSYSFIIQNNVWSIRKLKGIAHFSPFTIHNHLLRLKSARCHLTRGSVLLTIKLQANCRLCDFLHLDFLCFIFKEIYRLL